MGYILECECVNICCDYNEKFLEGPGFASFDDEMYLSSTLKKIASGKFNHHKKCKEIFDSIRNNKYNIEPKGYRFQSYDIFMCKDCKKLFSLEKIVMVGEQGVSDKSMVRYVFNRYHFKFFEKPICPYCGGKAKSMKEFTKDNDRIVCPKCGCNATLSFAGDWD